MRSVRGPLSWTGAGVAGELSSARWRKISKKAGLGRAGKMLDAGKLSGANTALIAALAQRVGKLDHKPWPVLAALTSARSDHGQFTSTNRQAHFVVRQRHVMRFVLAAMICVATGCSFIGVRVPDHPPMNKKLLCEPVLPVVDSIMAVPAIGYSGYVIAEESSSTTGKYGTAYIGLPLLALGLPYAASAIYGFHRYAKCRRLRRL